MIRDLLLGVLGAVGKPRASGDDPGLHLAAQDLGRVNPARAGMIPAPIRSMRGMGGKPRASGDDPEDGAVGGVVEP